MRSSEDRQSSPLTFGFTVAIGVTLLFNLGAAILTGFLGESNLPWVVGFSQLTLMLLPTLFLARAMPIPRRVMLRLRPAHWTMYAAAVLGVLLLWPILEAYLIVQELYLIPDAWFDRYVDFQREMDVLYRELIQPQGGVLNLIQALLIAAIIPAIAEETLYRGAVQRAFEERLGAMASILLASIIFVALHLHPVNVLPLLAVSLLLGLLARASRSLYPAILGHFMFNGVTVVALALESNRRDPAELQSFEDLMTIVPYAALALAPTVLLYVWLVRRARAVTPDSGLDDRDELAMRNEEVQAP